MHSSFVRTRNQRKADEESQKYKSKWKYNPKKKVKIPAGACTDSEEPTVNAKKQAIVCNEDKEQEPPVTPSDPNEEGLRSENEILPEQTDDAEGEIGRASEAESRITSRKRGGRGPAKAKRLPLSSHD